MTALGIALGSYLALCSRSAQFGARSVSVDQSQQLAQTGLEEALWALNQNSWTSSGPDNTSTWTTSGANRTTTLTYTLPAPNGTGRVVLTIANYSSTSPTWPTTNYTSTSAAWPTITSAATITLPSGQTFTKTLQATTGPAPLFANAIASTQGCVTFSDGGLVNSWNSNPDNDDSTAMVPYATAIVTPTAANFNAVVAGRTNGTGYGVVLMKATVNGYASTFGLPIGYSTSGTPAPKLQGLTTAAGVNIDTSRIGKSAFVPGAAVFTVSPPTSFPASNLLDDIAALVNSLGLITIGSTGSFKTSSNFIVNGGLLGGDTLTINGHVQFVIDGNFKINPAELLVGAGSITINPGSSLEIFVNGTVTIDGNGFNNKTGEPKNLAIYCTATGTTPKVIYKSSKSFCGVIYSENRPIDIQDDTGDFYGALLSRNDVTFSASSPKFHYDSALRNVRFPGITTPYILKRITEL